MELFNGRYRPDDRAAAGGVVLRLLRHRLRRRAASSRPGPSAHGWSAHELFFFTRILAAPIGIVAFFLVAAFGERFERKTWMLVASILYSVCFLLLFVFPHSFAGPGRS